MRQIKSDALSVNAAKLWPRGAPADVAEALASMRLAVGVFEGNASEDPAWVTDGHVMFRADAGGHRANVGLIERLAAKPPKGSREKIRAKGIAHYVCTWVGSGRFSLDLTALWLTDKEVPAARFRVQGGPPAVDIDARLLRLFLACVGPWDRVSWDGVSSATGAISLWAGGRLLGSIAHMRAETPVLVCAVPKNRVLAGSALPEPPAAPRPRPASPVRLGFAEQPNPLEALDEVAGELGGGRVSATRWRVPTTGGWASVGLKDGHVLCVFEEPLRVMSVPGQLQVKWGLGVGHVIAFDSPRLFWSWLVEFGLAIARGEPLPPPSAPDYGKSFESVNVGGRARIVDVAAGAFLRGDFPPGRLVRPVDELAARLSRARELREEASRWA